MKYMGSKRAMLANGLGKILLREAASAKRFADLFVGSSAVAWHVSEKTSCPVLAADLQLFAVSLAEAVVSRDVAFVPGLVWDSWATKAETRIQENPIYRDALDFEKSNWKQARRQSVAHAREICLESQEPLTKAYGGHYFSPKQAVLLDALRATVPLASAERSVALAALICAASECAGAPGHTAQPFQPTKNAAPYLFDAWRRDICAHVKSALKRICPKVAQVPGSGTVCDAETLAEKLGPGDLAFIDPPYSGVHYSRFYHVLETVARGSTGAVSGVGRYPAPSERPKSDFSISSKSEAALDRLFSKLAERDVRAIVTFPQEETSNGLSGTIVQTVAEKYFKASKTVVNGRFSTLGGNLQNRKARIPAYEIILVLTPRA